MRSIVEPLVRLSMSTATPSNSQTLSTLCPSEANQCSKRNSYPD
uniref:Uncharacterized protein n=1 Tax=Tetranychus urticae TaxID=32264 RepID=T1L3Y9_TETUR